MSPHDSPEVAARTNLRVEIQPAKGVPRSIAKDAVDAPEAVTVIQLSTTVPLKKGTIDKRKFDEIYRAAKAVHAAIAVGVSYIKFTELLQEFATELSILRDKTVIVEEVALAGLFEKALSAYHDSRVLWGHKIRASDDLWENEIPFFDRNDDVGEIAMRHNLRISEHTKDGIWFGLPSHAPQLIWVEAERRLNSAIEVFLGQRELIINQSD